MAEEEVQARKLLEKLSRMGFSRTELAKIEESFEVPVFRKKLMDPEFSSKLLESFEVPVFRETFFNDPISAIQNLTGRTKVTNVGLGERTKRI